MAPRRAWSPRRPSTTRRSATTSSARPTSGADPMRLRPTRRGLTAAAMLVLAAAPAAALDQYPLPAAGSRPLGIAAGPDGALWFAEYTNNKIGRLTTGGELR